MANNNKYVKGTVSHVMNHQHSYYVDSDGNGWTSLECHPENKSVCHKHKIRNHQVVNAKSPCHPFCKDRYGVDGVATHSHVVKSKSASPIKNFKKKTMNEIRRSSTKVRPITRTLNRNSMGINSGNKLQTSLNRPTKNRRVNNNGRVNPTRPVNNNQTRNRGGGGSY